jgi:hypothetical protein
MRPFAGIDFKICRFALLMQLPRGLIKLMFFHCTIRHENGLKSK